MTRPTSRRRPNLRVSCFYYLQDPPGLTSAAHKNATINELAGHIVQHPELLKDLARLLLRNTVVQPPGTPAISPFYRKTKGGRLNTLEQRLGELLDKVYETQRQDELNHWRGVVLERIVWMCIKSRATEIDTVLENVSCTTKLPA